MSAQVDPAPILDLIEAFRRSKMLFTAVRLGIFDCLEGQPQPAKQIAEMLNLNHEALERFLDACVGLGLLVRDSGQYGNAQVASRYLASTSPDSLAGYILYSDQSLYKLWDHLDDAVREGTNRWVQTFGSREALFDFYFRDEKATAAFIAGMHGFGQISSPRVAAAFDLSGFKHLVDLGGATGHLAIAACQAYPNLRATVLDLERVVPYAEKEIARRRLENRIRVMSGDFFVEPLPPGDLYALGRIIHDWNETKIGDLLAKVFAALPAGGGLLLAEKLLEDNRTAPVSGLMQDINMLVCTDGRERTFAEYEKLLREAGFADVEHRRTGAPLDAVLARKN